MGAVPRHLLRPSRRLAGLLEESQRSGNFLSHRLSFRSSATGAIYRFERQTRPNPTFLRRHPSARLHLLCHRDRHFVVRLTRPLP